MLIIQKYGGSSLKTSQRIKAIAKRIVNLGKKNSLVIVVSALGDTTDELLNLASQVSSKPPQRELDMLISTGEQISSSLLTMAICSLKRKAISFTGLQSGIITDTSHTEARILNINPERIKKFLKDSSIVVVAGFQGATTESEITTLGRGGSDLTAVALAVVLKADKCEIYTDVEGVFTADPKILPTAKRLKEINYEEMLELSSLGSEVLQLRSVEMAKKNNIPIYVGSSFNPKKGTLILGRTKEMEEHLITGITIDEGEAKVTILDVPDKPGIAARIFEHIGKKDINVDMIIQNISHQPSAISHQKPQTDLSFTIQKGDLEQTLEEIKKVADKIGARGVDCDENIAKVSVVGVGMRSHPGVAAKVFSALAEQKINIEMISTSEIKISCVVNKKDGRKAVRAIHKKFKLGK